jgi:hypothetical protein
MVNPGLAGGVYGEVDLARAGVQDTDRLRLQCIDDHADGDVFRRSIAIVVPLHRGIKVIVAKAVATGYGCHKGRKKEQDEI